MVVDSATEVLRLRGDQIEPPPSVITEKINTDYIEGVGILDERLLILLDLAKVLQAKEVQHIAKMQKKLKKQRKNKFLIIFTPFFYSESFSLLIVVFMAAQMNFD